MPVVRGALRRRPAGRVRAPGHPRRLGAAVPHHGLHLRGAGDPHPRAVHRGGAAVSREEAGAVVRVVRHRARGGGGRIRRRHVAGGQRGVPLRRAAARPARGPRRRRGGGVDHHALDAAREHGCRGASRPRVHCGRDRRPRAGRRRRPRSPRSRRRCARRSAAASCDDSAAGRSRARCRHPWLDRVGPVARAGYGALEGGTGVVHTAPGHGLDDYVAGLRYGLEVLAPVDDRGRFTADVAEWAGQRVFDADPKIVEHLRAVGALLAAEDYVHSYPHCWRCKHPIVYRATEQWFPALDTPLPAQRGAAGDLREKALRRSTASAGCRRGARPHSRHDLDATRTGACPASATGVSDRRALLRGVRRRARHARALRHVAAIFEREGADAWFARPSRSWCRRTRARAAGWRLPARDRHPRRLVRLGRHGAPWSSRGRSWAVARTCTSRGAISIAAGSTGRC